VSHGEHATLRTARSPADWRAVRELCCRTGNSGDPIEASRWPFFADLWIGPYQRLTPEWTYVVDTGREVVGYLTGCPDTAAFKRSSVHAVTLPLLLHVLRGAYGWNGDTRRFVRQTLGFRTGPERRLLKTLRLNLYREYPAHLHMNIEARFRGRGLGRDLVERYLEDLRTARVRGAHLFCGSAPREFYTRLGFHELGRLELPSGIVVHALAQPLTASEPASSASGSSA
jgi:GNAT superfamily N-acetyltransferase